jgi:hypothetical protein
MIEDMSIRKFTPGTQYAYVRFVKEFPGSVTVRF